MYLFKLLNKSITTTYQCKTNLRSTTYTKYTQQTDCHQYHSDYEDNQANWFYIDKILEKQSDKLKIGSIVNSLLLIVTTSHDDENKSPNQRTSVMRCLRMIAELHYKSIEVGNVDRQIKIQKFKVCTLTMKP